MVHQENYKLNLSVMNHWVNNSGVSILEKNWNKKTSLSGYLEAQFIHWIIQSKSKSGHLLQKIFQYCNLKLHRNKFHTNFHNNFYHA